MRDQAQPDGRTEAGYADDCAVIPTQLTVLTTSACDARCAHCLVRSGPEREDTLRTENIIDAVERAHRANPLSVVVFAGGEPTMLGDAVLDAVAHVSMLGVRTRMVSNGGWATTPAAAREMLTTLREAGLNEINISADDFHLPFIPLDNVVNAWRASKGLGFESVVIALCSGPGSKVTPESMMARLGEEVPVIYDDEGNKNPLPEPAADGTRYLLANHLVYRIGRGRRLREKYVRLVDSLDQLNGACPWAVRSAAVSPKNHLVACCGIEAEHNPVLDFGSLDDSGLEKLVAGANGDPLVQAIATLGPQYLMRRSQELDPGIEYRPGYTAICEICEDVTTNPRAVAVLRQDAARIWSDVVAVRVGQVLAQSAAPAGTGPEG